MSRQQRKAQDPKERGQILVLAALLMVILIGITGLAIDVSAAYMADRWQRAVADAAALAGGQDLQIPGSRALPGVTQYQNARKHAMDLLVSELRGTSTPSVALGSPCLTAAGCALPGTPYVVAIRTNPSPSHVDCDPQRCIQVTIRQPAFGLTFGRIFGQSTWIVSSASVAGIVQAPQYGIVTLRPPDPRGGTQNQKDLFINSSNVFVQKADVGTNTNVVCSGFASGAELRLDTAFGFAVYHFDPFQAWTSGAGACLNPPSGVFISSPIEIPPYQIPTRTGATPIYSNAAAAMDPSAATCAAQQLLVPDEYRELKTNQKINDLSKVTVTCFLPGVYNFTLDAKDPANGLPNAFLLEPGVYFFDYGVKVESSLIGGYVPNKPGVALVFKEANTTNPGGPGQFTTTRNISLLALNVGNKYCPGPAGTVCPSGRFWATAAQGPQGLVQTPAPNSILLTVMVEPDPNCTVGLVEPTSCNDNKNKTIGLTGGGNIFLAGVQFAPSDNSALQGNSGQRADIGAFWAWTIQFSGGTEFNLSGSDAAVAGVLRLDPACSPTVSVCNP
jgi:hypothetical protein